MFNVFALISFKDFLHLGTSCCVSRKKEDKTTQTVRLPIIKLCTVHILTYLMMSFCFYYAKNVVTNVVIVGDICLKL